MISELYNFQKYYLLKIVQNIPEEKFFKNEPNKINSPGWIIGHLIVEIQDIFNHLNIQIESLPENWFLNFKGGKSLDKFNIKSLATKKELIQTFELRYDILMKIYSELTEEQKSSNHPSKMFSETYTNIDSWITHHLITHLAVHIGNITTWKKINDIKVNGI